MVLELQFISSHKITDEVTERAALYSLQTCIESVMDIVALKVKDLGLVVADDYTNHFRKLKDSPKPKLAVLTRASV